MYRKYRHFNNEKHYISTHMDRRDFLKKAAAGAVAAGIAATGAGAAGLREPLPGCGRQGYDTPGPGDRRQGRFAIGFEPYELRMRHTFTVSGYSRTTTPDVQLRIWYDGFTGYGEASMPQYLGQTTESVMAFLRKVDLGRFPSPFLLEDILSYVDGLSDGDTAAKAAVDIALHDLVGKLLGAPWYRIWGLDPQKAPCTSFTIGIDTPEVVREKTLECAGRFKVLKAKVGVPDDRKLISTIREVTDLPLVVDANQGWTDRQAALDEIFWLKEMGVLMVEQPMPAARLDDNAWISERSPIPVFADEAVQRLADIPGIKGAYNGINIKLMKCTGMREAWKMLNYARAEGMKVMLGCMTETSCAVSAAAQLSPAVDFADLDGNLLISNDIFNGVKVVEGRLSLGDAPGIGIVPE